MLCSVRPYDLVGRYDAERFLMVLPGCGGPFANQTAERLRQAFCLEPVNAPAGSLGLTVSCGVSIAASGGGWDVESIIRAAIEALDRADRAGGNRVEQSQAPCS